MRFGVFIVIWSMPGGEQEHNARQARGGEEPAGAAGGAPAQPKGLPRVWEEQGVAVDCAASHAPVYPCRSPGRGRGRGRLAFKLCHAGRSYLVICMLLRIFRDSVVDPDPHHFGPLD